MGNIAMGPGQDVFGPSQTLWGNIPLDRILWDRDTGWFAGDDFRNIATNAAPSSNAALYYSEGNTYNSYEGSSTQTVVPTDANWTVPSAFNVYSPNGGAILYPGGTVIPTPGQLTLTPASSAPANLVQSPNAAGTAAGVFTPYPISSGAQGITIFECRLRISDLPTGKVSWFVGLAGTAVVSATLPVGDNAYSTVPSLLGFGSLESDAAGKISLVYNKAGGTVSHQGVTNMAGLNLMILGNATGITAGTATPTISVAGAGGIPSVVASTWIGSYFKLGFKFDPVLGTLTPYINGIPQNGQVAPNKVVGSGSLSTNLGTAAPGTGSATLWPADPMNFACASALPRHNDTDDHD